MNNRKIKLYIFSLLLVGSFFLFTLLRTGDGEAPSSEQTLRIAMPADIHSLDIASSYDNKSSQILHLVSEGLTRRDRADKLQLAIARSYTISEDKKCYTFHLRDCNWSDGYPITAHDFVYSWRRSIDPSSRFVAQTPYYFYPIKHAKQCFLGELSIDEVAIWALDDKTLFVELASPTPYFLDLVSLPDFSPLPQHAMEGREDWGFDENIVYSGPFVVKSWKKSNRIELAKNPHYWDCDSVRLDAIRISIVESPATALMMFEKGELDWVGSPFLRMSHDISAEVLSHEKEDTFSYWFFINTEKYPLNNQKLRRALSYAIDRKSIVANVFHASGAPATSPLPPPLALREGGCFQDGNIALAQQLFREVLVELEVTKESFPPIELSYVLGLEIHHRTAQAIQDQWRKVFGLSNISLRKTEWPIHFDRVSKGDYDIGFMGWSSTGLDPTFILEAFQNRSDATNKSNWENKQYQKCLSQAKHTIDKKKREKLLREAEEILMEEMPIIPLCFPNKRYAKNPKLQGENLSSLSFIDFKTAYFEQQH